VHSALLDLIESHGRHCLPTIPVSDDHRAHIMSGRDDERLSESYRQLFAKKDDTVRSPGWLLAKLTDRRPRYLGTNIPSRILSLDIMASCNVLSNWPQGLVSPASRTQKLLPLSLLRFTQSASGGLKHMYKLSKPRMQN
jgi:hypothetical protein